MVMEAATLSGPHRKCAVVPVQKSLSLPSYARAGGEGIDHKLIFAALEQKERVRRKSRIFAPRKEKCDRPSHLFCLPIPSSGAKCRETSLSSDTSCSSLEYKKSSPVLTRKETVPKPRKGDASNSGKEDTTKSDKESTLKPSKQETSTYETATTIKSESKTTAISSRTHQNAIDWEANLSRTKPGINSNQKISENRKDQRNSMDTLRLTVCSSDSMERSSRSSSDSLSRKERMIALKARVEAAREKYGNTSSSEEEAESRLAITRYNSDGVIHRSVRDVKSRSYLREKRLRRRSQDEFSVKKVQRKQNLSLSINPEGDGIRLDLEKSSRTQFSNNNLDIKTDFCPSPNFPDMLKKNYFSDFPSKENAMHFVQARIRHIEDEERKRRSGSDFHERFGIQKMQNHENSELMASTELRRPFEKPNELSNTKSEIKTSNFDLAMRSSPIPKSAPTPPPRSPKSMTFINKALIQHQNSLILNQENSLERKKVFLSNVPALSYSQIFEKFDSKIDLSSGEAKFTDSPNNTSEKQKIKELFSSRRKTCGNFDFIDNNILDELCSIGNSVCSTTSNLTANKKFSSALQIKKTENKGYFSSTETPGFPSEDDARNKMWKSKWQEIEQRKEYMFNSLENRKKSNFPSCGKWRAPPSKTETCLCHLFPESKLSCSCKSESKQMHSSASDTSKLEAFSLVNPKDVSSLPVRYSSSKLKLDTNAAGNDLTLKTSKDQQLKLIHLTRENITNGESTLKNENTEKLSAAANLDSAMEELENVYRSLKMSSDNLSDRNSISNISLSDDEVKFPKPKNKDILGINDSRFPRRSSVCETGLGSNKNFNYHKPTICSPLKYVLPVSNDKNSEINQCSIDELFNDLTQQLDLEQKLLKDPKDNRYQQPKLSLPANRFDSPKRSNKPSPQVSLHKEFYENLCKNNRDQITKNHSPRVSENGTSSSVEPPDKKRQKAVRSLSENISYLMSTAHLDSDDKKTSDNTLKTMQTDQPLQKCYDRILPDTTTNFGSKRDTNFNQSSLSNKSEEKSLNLKRDEIRHIRVSMDTNILQSDSITSSNSFSDCKQYPSLSSAVSATQSSGKSEIPKPCLPEQNYESKENLDVLDETGLEKLLNSLLGEVPERQSSLSQTKDLEPTTPPPVVPGKLQNVTINRSTALQKMDACFASKGKSKSPGTESYLKNVKSEEHAQKVTFRQNDNSLNQPSFIPVYTKKTDMCHNFTKNSAEDKNKPGQVESSESVKLLNNLHSPPPRQKCLTDQIPGMAWNTHLRRRSVGFEDVASLSHNYGFNLANKRMQSAAEKF
ncbi:hypothetical protein HNY73_003212 [Argiope bruennichi]|uniref:Uncharacterized protein n=2 Tax=Argiope bruennichi TaxID=94029 RepID=A0A8T0FW63_ARGBR|nr:hypothetical protein HNY73_003212 [Argiope bruennichi]